MQIWLRDPPRLLRFHMLKLLFPVIFRTSARR